MGILYETEKYLHNWALSFALFNINYIPHCYRMQGDKAQKPTYLDENSEQNLLHLNQAKIYVFPAQPINWSYQVNTFKAAQVSYYGKTKQFGDKGADKNYPINYGRAKEIAVGSKYRTYIIAPDNIKLPQWIRLGKWSAKIKVEIIKIPDTAIEHKSGTYICNHPLNPLDLSPNTSLLLYNRIVMPPVSLISQAQLNGEYWKSNHHKSNNNDNWEDIKKQHPQLPNQLTLPKGTFYGARNNLAA